jgi:hypothetical protein
MNVRGPGRGTPSARRKGAGAVKAGAKAKAGVGGALVPTLDGEAVRRDHDLFVHGDGRPVDAARHDDIVFVPARAAGAAPSTQAKPKRPALDVVAALRGLGALDDDDEPALDAGFFHRALLKSLGHSEAKSAPAVAWSFDFWKATAACTSVQTRGKARAAVWEATLHRTADGAPEVVRYELLLDGRDRIQSARFLTAAPVFGGDAAPAPLVLDESALARVFADG